MQILNIPLLDRPKLTVLVSKKAVANIYGTDGGPERL